MFIALGYVFDHDVAAYVSWRVRKVEKQKPVIGHGGQGKELR